MLGYINLLYITFIVIKNYIIFNAITPHNFVTFLCYYNRALKYKWHNYPKGRNVYVCTKNKYL